MRTTEIETKLVPSLSRRSFMLTAPFVLTGVTAAIAETTGASNPDSPVKLWVDGDISVRNHGDEFVLDQRLLDELPQAEFATSTIWTEGVHTYSGPTLQGLLDLVDAGPGDLVATALNDYRVTLDRSYIEESAPILATRINGKTFSVREKGPLWIIFPFDENPRFHDEVIYAMSVWQLERLTVVGA
ncbi:MAG TPA: hypothetical protein VIC08_05105 [Cellvibrionaceae bacterium]